MVDITIHSFVQKRKWIVLRRGRLVYAYPSLFELEWIWFEMREWLAMVQQLFGSWCLIGVRERMPHIGMSLKLCNSSLYNIVIGTEVVEQMSIQNSGPSTRAVIVMGYQMMDALLCTYISPSHMVTFFL